MKIKKFSEYGENSNLNEKRTELFGVDRSPSNVISRQDQDFYDYYTRGKFRGLSKYELNSKIFELAQGDDDLAVLAQFCLQIERESIAADDYIVDKVEELADKKNKNHEKIKKDLDDIRNKTTEE